MKKGSVLIINGPNLNLLGTREPEKYGSITLKQIEGECFKKASGVGFDIEFFQSNSEGEIVTKIQQFEGSFLIINLGAYSHTSIACYDALLFAKQKSTLLKVVEVHLSNIYQREDFRHKSFISKVADGVVCGLKHYGYLYAIDYCYSCFNV